jgi:DNA-binding NarL/FixJ family response regulator
LGIDADWPDAEVAWQIVNMMKVFISARELEILRKAVYGLTTDEIAHQLKMDTDQVQRSLKSVMKNTHAKEPIEALQNLAKNGFQLAD